MKRGDIYWAELQPRSGSEQCGRRPVLIVSHDGFNLAPGWRSVIVVPLSTSANQARRGPTAVPVPERSAGLKKPGAALCHQVTTLDRAKLDRFIGALPAEFMERVEAGLKAALQMD